MKSIPTKWLLAASILIAPFLLMASQMEHLTVLGVLVVTAVFLLSVLVLLFLMTDERAYRLGGWTRICFGLIVFWLFLQIISFVGLVFTFEAVIPLVVLFFFAGWVLDGFGGEQL